MLLFLLTLSDLNRDDKLLHIYRCYYPEMLKIANSIFKGEHRTLDAEDAVQNAFLSLQKYLNNITFWDEEKRLHAYVITTVKAEAYKLLNNAIYYEEIGEYADMLVSDDDFIQQINRAEDYSDIVNAIARLDDRYTVPMYLHWVDGLSAKEVAAQLGLPIKTVYTQLSRGKYLLLKYLRKESDIL